MSKFVSNKLAKKINSVAADLCCYSTFHGTFQSGGYTHIIDRAIATITGIDVSRRIVYGNAAASDWVYGCSVASGYTPAQAQLAHTILNGLADLHTRIGQDKFNTVLFGLKQYTRDSGWQQDLSDRKASLYAEIAELETAISAGEQKLAERTAEYRRCPTDSNHWHMQWAADDVQGNKWRLAHLKEAITLMPTPETVVAKLRAALIEQGILPA